MLLNHDPSVRRLVEGIDVFVKKTFQHEKRGFQHYYCRMTEDDRTQSDSARTWTGGKKRSWKVNYGHINILCNTWCLHYPPSLLRYTWLFHAFLKVSSWTSRCLRYCITVVFAGITFYLTAFLPKYTPYCSPQLTDLQILFSYRHENPLHESWLALSFHCKCSVLISFLYISN